MKGIANAKRVILAAKEIVVSCHTDPDGDAIGSMLALGLGLKRLGKKVNFVIADSVPKKYGSLPGAKLIRRRIKSRPDLAIAVDCGIPERLGTAFTYFENASEVIEIDHHLFRRPFGTVALIDHKAAAVAEQVYILLKKLGVKITDEIAENLLTSIIVETNSFRLPTVRALTFRICAALMKSGVEFQKLSELVYWNKSREIAVLEGLCLASCKFMKNGRLAWSIVKQKDLKKAGGRPEDVDAVADEIRAIKGVRIAVLFREEKGKLRVSVRSKGLHNVADVAGKYGGGGHYDVAGCFIKNKKSEIEAFLRDCAKLLK